MTRRVLQVGRSTAVVALTCCALFFHNAEAASTKIDGPILIEAYGDSTTLGITCSDGHCAAQANNAVAYLQDELQARHGARVQVANYGVGGTTAAQLRDGTGNRRAGPTAGLAWQARLAASPAQIVLINYGINEVMQNQTPAQFYDAETALVKTAQALGKQAVLQTSNPMPDNRLNARLAAMVAMTRRVAAEQHAPLVDQFAYIGNLPDWKTLMSDGAHPRPALYQLKAGQDFQVVDPLVQRLLDRPR